MRKGTTKCPLVIKDETLVLDTSPLVHHLVVAELRDVVVDLLLMPGELGVQRPEVEFALIHLVA